MTNVTRSSVAKGAVWLSVSSAIAALAGIIIVYFETRYLTTLEFGFISYLTMLIILFMTIGTLALPRAITVYVASLRGIGKHDDANSIFWNLFRIGIGLSIIFGFITYISGNLLIAPFLTFENLNLLHILVAIDVALLINTQFIRGSLNGTKRFKWMNVAQSSGAILIVILTIIFLIQGYSILGIMFARVFGDGVEVIIGSQFLVKDFRRSDGETPGFREIVSFTAPIYSSDVLSYINSTLDRYLVLTIAGTIVLGIYSPAIAAGSLLLVLFASMTNVLFSALSELEKQEVEYKQHEVAASKWLALITIPAAIGLSSVSRPVIDLFVGPAYADSTPALMIFSFVIGLSYLSPLVQSKLLGTGRTTPFLLASVTAIFLDFLVSLLLIPPLGLIGAVIARSIGLLSLLLVPLIILKRSESLNVDVRAARDAFLASGVMAIISLVLQYLYYNPLLILLYLGIGGLAYAISIRGLGTLNQEDSEFIQTVFSKRMKIVPKLITWLLVGNQDTSSSELNEVAVSDQEPD